MVVVEEVVVSSIEPLSLAHFLEGPGKLIRVVLNYGFDVPYLRAFSLWPIP